DVRQAIELLDSDGASVSGELYTVDAVNYLSGAVINIGFDLNGSANLPYGDITLNLNTDITALSGKHLLQPFSAQYRLVNGFRPQVDLVKREGSNSHYFHGEGGEVALIQGAGYGTDASQIAVFFGDTQVSSDNVLSVSENTIKVNFPTLFLGLNTTTLAVSVQRLEVADILYGAVVIMPTIGIEDINPPTGPPQGGNDVDLFGSGFNPSTQVYFGGRPANDIRVLASHHIRVRAPASEFGYVAVSAVNPQFPNEFGYAPVEYFFAGKATGSVNLSRDAASPVSAIVRNGQLLYTLTGGHYEVIDINGTVLETPSTATAQLIVVDISDPVNPVTLSKTFAGSLKPYFYQSSLSPEGFTDIVLQGNDLYAIGGDKLLRFDVSLASDPLLVEDIDVNQTNHAIAVADDVVYLSRNDGISIYYREQNQDLRQIGDISKQIMGGTATRLVVDDQTLWALIPATRQVVGIELMSGQYQVIKQIKLIDATGYDISAVDILVRNNWLMVSTGELATVELFDMLPEGGAHLANLNLSYLIRNG
ncbi:MAG: IPT/TIG domain-containing protein, partial [Psychrosphaera sp.]|nr:IPT/TIG domain-containing protein [Psychrosphaera sp.]